MIRSEELVTSGWDNFYVMMGSSAGALLGLTFVVIALAADTKRVNPRGLRAFISPTIGHFSTVLAVAGFMLVPRHTIMSLSLGFGLAGGAGLIYSIFTGVHMRRIKATYVPVLEDWLWHVLFPMLTYVSFLILAMLIWYAPGFTLDANAGALAVMLFIGVHNAWDVATSISVRRQDETT